MVSQGRVLYGDDERIADLVLSLLPHLTGKWTHYAALGVLRQGELYGGVVFHDYTPRAADIRITAAFKGRHWATRGMIRSMLGYVVGQLECRRLTMMIAADNIHAVAFAQRAGFVLEGCLRRGHDGTIDRLIYGAFVEELCLPGGPHG